jgi:hypothetical protein
LKKPLGNRSQQVSKEAEFCADFKKMPNSCFKQKENFLTEKPIFWGQNPMV